jgi:hypothetical protein
MPNFTTSNPIFTYQDLEVLKSNLNKLIWGEELR